MAHAGFHYFDDFGEGSLAVHYGEPADGFVALSYEPAADDSALERDAIIVPEKLFTSFVKAYKLFVEGAPAP
jgi:hypothetical protein